MYLLIDEQEIWVYYTRYDFVIEVFAKTLLTLRTLRMVSAIATTGAAATTDADATTDTTTATATATATATNTDIVLVRFMCHAACIMYVTYVLYAGS